MKVMRDSGFTPLTIVIETQEEADNIWHRLNCNGNLESYAKDMEWNQHECNFDMFQAFNGIYTPPDQRD